MLNSKAFDDLAPGSGRRSRRVPPRTSRRTCAPCSRPASRALDLVPRAEFDVQAQVLLKTREKLEALEARLAEIEKRLPAGKTE